MLGEKVPSWFQDRESLGQTESHPFFDPHQEDYLIDLRRDVDQGQDFGGNFLFSQNDDSISIFSAIEEPDMDSPKSALGRSSFFDEINRSLDEIVIEKSK